MRLVSDDHQHSLPCMDLEPEQLRIISSPQAIRILKLLLKNPKGMHGSHIARELGEAEQKLHYHIRRLKSVHAIEVDHLQDTTGGTAKVLRATSPAFATRFAELEPFTGTTTRQRQLLTPFVEQGRWNASIVVGSPDPHGPEGVRSRDAVFAFELGMFIGMHLNTPPRKTLVLDTNLTSWKQHMIIVGGPVVNKAARQVNANSPAVYVTETRSFQSKKTGNIYNQDNVGVITKFANPRAQGYTILHLAGKRSQGTQAAVMAVRKETDEVEKRLEKNGIVVVEGIDADSDGTIDTIKFLE